MWRYGLLGTPAFGLGLFYLLPFEPALLIYLPGVCLACWLYDRLAARQSTVCENGAALAAQLGRAAITDGSDEYGRLGRVYTWSKKGQGNQ